MRRADSEMQQKIEALIQEEADPRERARLLILYQIATAHDNVTIAGNDISSNATGPVTLGATTNASVVGNTPSTLVSRTPSTIDVVKFNSAYTPTATGGDKGAGTVNVAAGLFKNNTAYTNP